MNRALHADYLVGEQRPSLSRRWTPEAREAQRQRINASRAWLASVATGRGPSQVYDAEALEGAVSRFLPPVNEAPLPRGVPFVATLA